MRKAFQMTFPCILIFRPEMRGKIGSEGYVIRQIAYNYEEFSSYVKNYGQFYHAQVNLHPVTQIVYCGHTNKLCSGISAGKSCSCIDYHKSCCIGAIGFDIDPEPEKDYGIDDILKKTSDLIEWCKRKGVKCFANFTGGGVQIFIPISGFYKWKPETYDDFAPTDQEKLYSLHNWLNGELYLFSDNNRWKDIAWRPRIAGSYNHKPNRQLYCTPLSEKMLNAGTNEIIRRARARDWTLPVGVVIMLGGHNTLNVSSFSDELYNNHKPAEKTIRTGSGVKWNDLLKPGAGSTDKIFKKYNLDIDYLQRLTVKRSAIRSIHNGRFYMIRSMLDAGMVIEDIDMLMRSMLNEQDIKNMINKRQIYYAAKWWLDRQ